MADKVNSKIPRASRNTRIRQLSLINRHGHKQGVDKLLPNEALVDQHPVHKQGADKLLPNEALVDQPSHISRDDCNKSMSQNKPETSRDDASMIESLEKVLTQQDQLPSGPVYQSTHKLLAELYIKSQDEESAIYHLTESHAPTLRSQACMLMYFNLSKNKGDPAILQTLKNQLSFRSKWQDGFPGLKRRLAELPHEWTAVQLTLEADPLSRFFPRSRNANRGLGMHVTRFSCGPISQERKQLGELENPFRVSIPPFSCNEMSIMASIKGHLEKMSSTTSRHNRTKVHDECNSGIMASITDLEMWLGPWHFLFHGKLIDKDLIRDIKSAVDARISLYYSTIQTSGVEHLRLEEAMKQIPERTLSLMYLCASTPSLSCSKVKRVLSTLLEDGAFAEYISNEIFNIKKSFLPRLLACKRYPIILVIDEDLDILPIEATDPLREQLITRIPSIHFLHALHHLHKNSTLMKGVDVQNGFYVVNPACNLPQLDATFKFIHKGNLQNWKGFFKKEPSHDEFLDGLKSSDVFLYCGHGSGIQYLPRDSIERARIGAVALIFGCASNSLQELGGRVEMYSLANSYLLAGSPCVVGMLWNVLDHDVNAMTQKLMKVWQGRQSPTAGGDRDDEHFLKKFSDMNLDHDKSTSSTKDLLEAVTVSRKEAVRCLNRAAMVVRGLPVKASVTHQS